MTRGMTSRPGQPAMAYEPAVSVMVGKPAGRPMGEPRRAT